MNLLSREIHTAMPARVESVTPGSPLTVNVMPLLRSVGVSGVQRDFNIISGVLLLTLGTSKSSIYMPVKTGDLVLLVFCERSLDKWKADNNIADTIPGRMFELADAFAIPFNFNVIADATYGNTDTVIAHKTTLGTVKASLLDSGNVAIETPPLGKVTLNGKLVSDGGTLLPTDGVVTGMCSCSITGAPHPVVSLTVLAKGLVP
jgi:hypothetical protein